MPATRYPFVLKERFGGDAYDALADMVDDRQNARLGAIEAKLSALNDRIDHLDDKIDHLSARVDDKFAASDERFERRLGEDLGGVRLEISGLRTEMVAQRADLLKWAMVSWVSQAAAVAAIVAVFR